MKKTLILLLTLILFFGAQALAQNPVTWTAIYKANNANEGEIILSAKIENGWHTYSMRPTDVGPFSTGITFTPSKQYELIGKTEESEAHEEFDKALDAKLFVFTDKAEFKQKIKLKSKPGFLITCTIEYICCNDRMCQPPKTVVLNVKIQ